MVLTIVLMLAAFLGGGFCGWKYGSKTEADVVAEYDKIMGTKTEVTVAKGKVVSAKPAVKVVATPVAPAVPAKA